MAVPIEAVRTGMGFDKAGRWHQANVRYMPVRRTADDPLTTARGLVWGVLASSVLWASIFVVARVLFHLLR
jgi:hypothetical protein